MKLLTALLSLAALFFALASATNPEVVDWRNKCYAKHPAVVSAVNKFCEAAGFSNHVPRQWSVDGISSSTKYQAKMAHVAISGNCSPQQWVPKKYCYLQFFQMCVNSDHPDGTTLKNYGCQSWSIQRMTYQVPFAHPL